MNSIPGNQAQAWLSSLDVILQRGNATAAANLFGAQCFWRDLLAFTWNIRTVEGRDQVAGMLGIVLPLVGPRNFQLMGDAVANSGIIEAWFNFETALARGTGHLRLKDGQGFMVLTAMDELKGHEERSGRARELGIVHGPIEGRKTWSDEKAEEERELGYTRQPYCVIIGGGQSGIALGARLKRLGVPTIILEKNARAGDSWRNRYRSLILHDPVWYDHLPYIPFPAHWPVFTPKDKMGDWLEMYAKVLELNYWSSAECLKASYDPAAKQWSVFVRRNGKDLTLSPGQLIFATGSYGPPRLPEIAGMQGFEGIQYHSSNHISSVGFKGKNCIVLGSNSSAHDICADIWEHGGHATMIQRSPTTVVRSETLMDVAFSPLYSEEALAKGITTDKADLIFAAMPFRLMADAQRPLYEEMARRDADLIARLNKAGFMTDYGIDGSGLMMKALRTGSGYYIDVGCSELIASGRVGVRANVEISCIRRNSVVLTDGNELPADVIVYATGHLPMNEWVASIVSREAADLIGPNWGYGSGTPGDPEPWEGELRNMWKPLQHEALWFHGGNLHLSRHYSKFVALQLKARMEGLPVHVY